MSIFTVDQEKCKRDGLCAAVCPRTIIAVEINESYPKLVEGGEQHCIQCGHCSSICPHAALELEFMPLTAMTQVDRALLPNIDQLQQLVRSRRSIRTYKKEAVDRKSIQELIDLARYAPTGRNSQLLQWMVIDSQDTIQAIRQHILDWMKDSLAKKEPLAAALGFENILAAWDEGKDQILRDAPGIVLLHAPTIYPLGLVDSTIAMTTFELACVAANIGTCWAGFFMIATKSWKPLQDFLQLPEGYELTTALMVGYPEYRYSRVPARNEPVVTYR